MNLRSHSKRSDRRSANRRKGGAWLGAAFRALMLGTITLVGCAHQHVKRLYHSTVISYFPHRSALKPTESTDCVVDPHAYGFHRTEWRNWTSEWQETEVLIEERPAVLEENAQAESESPTPAPVITVKPNPEP